MVLVLPLVVVRVVVEGLGSGTGRSLEIHC
jgi:hypothetical protein